MIDKRHLGPSLFCLLTGLAIILFLSSGCRTSIPKIDVSLWAGDPAKDGISRAQEQRTMSCQAPEFAEMTCLTYVDLKKIYSTLLQCEKWGSAPMNTKEAKRFMQRNQEVLLRTVQSPREVFSYERQRQEVDRAIQSVDD